MTIEALERVLLHDKDTGREVWHESRRPFDEDFPDESLRCAAFWWTDGNAACDCNRGLFLARDLGLPEDDPLGDLPCSHHGEGRIVIKAATLNGLPLDVVDG